MAGYSKTPLAKKLGIKPGHRVALLHAPDGFAEDLDGLPEDVRPRDSLRGRLPLDLILLFADRAATLRRRFPVAIRRLDVAGGLWVGWPKKSSGLQRDLGEAEVRAYGLDAGLVDNKICAIDDTWSGLRFVVRREDREAWPSR